MKTIKDSIVKENYNTLKYHNMKFIEEYSIWNSIFRLFAEE